MLEIIDTQNLSHVGIQPSLGPRRRNLIAINHRAIFFRLLMFYLRPDDGDSHVYWRHLGDMARFRDDNPMITLPPYDSTGKIKVGHRQALNYAASYICKLPNGRRDKYEDDMTAYRYCVETHKGAVEVFLLFS